MKTLSELGQVLEEARTRAKLDYKDLAEMTGLTPLSVRNALQAKTALRATNLMALAEVLGLEMVLVPQGMASSLNASQPNLAPSNPDHVGDAAQKNRALFVPRMERVLQPTNRPGSPPGRGSRKP